LRKKKMQRLAVERNVRRVANLIETKLPHAPSIPLVLPVASACEQITSDAIADFS
jgi:hypothetical protein